MNGMKNESRIAFLDGLRGIAILLVVLYHAYARWPGLVPYGNTFAKLPIFAYGWLGVQLFFMISGFVIFMTLEKCRNFQEFILRRWLRLFPAMLVCSIAIFVMAPFFPERPDGPVSYSGLLPGLTFIQPDLWGMLGFSVKGIEGAFWSLYVEVKFYIIFGILYFVVGWRKAVVTLIGLFCIATIIPVLRKFAPTMDIDLISKIVYLTSGRCYGWFAAGALYYKYFREQRKTLLIYAMVIASLSTLVEGTLNWKLTLFALLVVMLFTFAIANTRVQALLTHPSLLFMGFISYPLYLLHENMMIAMIVKIGQQMPEIYRILIPVFPIAVVIGIAWFVTTYIESWTREQLRLPYKQFCILVGATRSTSSTPFDKKIVTGPVK